MICNAQWEQLSIVHFALNCVMRQLQNRQNVVDKKHL